MPKQLVKLENALAFGGLLYIYLLNHYSLWYLFLFFFLPDLAMLVYLWDQEKGAVIYNLSHTYLVPGTLALLALVGRLTFLWPFAIIWAAHIAMDRMLGFGLKYPEGFRVTSIQKL